MFYRASRIVLATSAPSGECKPPKKEEPKKKIASLRALCLRLLLRPANANSKQEKNPNFSFGARRIALASSAPSVKCKPHVFFCAAEAIAKTKKSQKFLLAVRASCVCLLRNASRKSLLLKASSKTKSQVKTFSGHAFCEIRTEKNKSRSTENRSLRRARALRPNVN